MKRRFVGFALCLFMILSVSSFVVASEGFETFEYESTSSTAQIDVDSIIEQLSKLDFGREIEVVSLEHHDALVQNDVSSNMELLYFDTVDDFIAYLESYFARLNNSTPMQGYILEEHIFDANEIVPFSTTTRNATLTFRTFFLDPLSYSLSFTYTFPSGTMGITSAMVTNSWLTGIHIGHSWVHRSGSATILNWFGGPCLRLTISGTMTFGAVIGGLPTHISWNETHTIEATRWRTSGGGWSVA